MASRGAGKVKKFLHCAFKAVQAFCLLIATDRQYMQISEITAGTDGPGDTIKQWFKQQALI